MLNNYILNDDNDKKPNNEEEEIFRKKVEELRKMSKTPKGSPLFFLVIFAILAFVYYFVISPTGSENTQKVTYTEFVNKIKTKDIKQITEKEDLIYGKIKGSKTVYETKKITTRLGDDQNIMNLVNENRDIEITAVNSATRSVFFQLIINLLPTVLLIALFLFFTRRLTGSGSGGVNPFNMGKSKTKLKEKPNVSFKDVAGLNEEKEELKEVVQFLKDPSKFIKAGARVPKGVLLLGEPGTGKTLLAKAVAGESGASFFNISGSEFVEMYVGVGASRVRDLFEEAKKNKPAIIFIDEIDAIGRKRGVGRNGGNDEREQTLNQLLVEMDGFETDAQIIVIAATNREDILDSALLRSGRFDRRIAIGAPDLQGRIDILNVHARNKQLAEDVKLEDIAKITPGFVGADLENLLNEAAINAARDNRNYIKMEDLDEAVDKIGMGLGQKSKLLSKEDRKMLAYHEGGHALVASLIPHTDKVHKVTIIPRGNAGGYTMTLPTEKLNMRKQEILAGMMVDFGGRVGEYLGMEDIGTGAYSDIQHATRYAKLFVQSYGLDDDLGPVNYEQSNSEEYAFIDSNSEKTKEKIDQRVKEILEQQYQKTLALLKENKETLDEIALLLLEKETVTGAEIRAIVKGNKHDEVLNMTSEQLEEYY